MTLGVVKRSFSDQSDLPIFGQTEAEQMIIQCPECQTKFAVDASIVSTMEKPRFHCSRCDALFVPPERPSPQPVTAEPVTRPAIPGTAATSLEQSIGMEVERPRPALVSTVEISAPPPSKRPEKPQKSISSSDFSLGNRPDGSEQKAAAAQGQMTPTSTPASRHEATKTQIITSAAARISDIIAPHGACRAESGTVATLRGRARGVLFFGAFFALLLGVLLTVTCLAWMNAGLAGGLLDTLVPGFMSPKMSNIPPPGLVVKQARIERTTLASGESVVVVHGKIMNSSDIEVRGVLMEVMTFDKHGTLLGRVRSPLASPLAREKLQDLSFERVSQLASATSSAKRSALSPGEQAPFTVTILDPNSSNPASFAARVFSVE